MTQLSIDSFPDFMRETTGFDPFPWQTRLLQTVLAGADGPGWPDLLDLPTGTGKTSTLHIAVFALAMRPDVMPRRVVLVVDRRVIVDQVHGVALRLVDKLAAAPSNTTSRAVADRLRECGAGEDPSPLRASLLRGGVPRDDAWIEAPEQPTIFASTVDQVGSRLLFRGYGVSPGMRPVHAGVMGTDTLYLLDEVHLASAFEKTLSDLQGYNTQRWHEYDGAIGRPLRVVRMSATPRQGATTIRTFHLDDEDRTHAVLSKRLEASRPARLQLVKTKAAPDASGANLRLVAEAAAGAATQLVEGGARTVGVVMNRVALAVATAKKLEASKAGQVLLITGRMRPFDRALVQQQIDALARSGNTVHTENPTFVVATSCIEAGADYDFDGLVTQVASLPALRQRFGRLNRLGEHEAASAYILGSKHELSKSAKPDPIYGESLANTWRFLEENATDGTIDFGLTSFPEIADDVMEGLRTPDAQPPTMFPGYLDQWSETRPAPHPDPEISLWLHGKEQDPDRDVSLIFRADIEQPKSNALDERTAESLEFIPPLPEEAVSIPLWQARAFIEDRASEEEPWVIRWSSEGPTSISSRQLSVGDVLVVPSGWGGLSHLSWDPDEHSPVVDIAERVYLARSQHSHGDGALFLRVNPAVVGEANLVPRPPLDEAAEDSEAWEAARETLEDWLRQPGQDDDSWLAELRRRAAGSAFEMESAADCEGCYWLVSWRLQRRGLHSTTEDSVSSFTGIEVTLANHLQDVRAWARGFATRAGIPDPVAEDVGLAGWLHDVGKADPRFQVLLRGGDPVSAFAGAPLAKSKVRTNARTREEARRRSGWPAGFRHELISLALFENSDKLRDEANDPDLVRHLIASHHGWCRPWSPSIDDPSPLAVRFELGGEVLEIETSSVDEELRFESASRFRRLCRRYGWHGLAYLEALLRLGDHQASRAPSTRPKDPAA